jgi:SAM-dependent methyltransferase
MLKLEWRDEARQVTCKACGATGEGRLVVTFEHPFGDSLDGVRCVACGSIDILDEIRDFAPDDAAVDDYVQTGAGIATVAARLWRERRDRPVSMLEVGCNFGFGIDFTRRSLHWSAIGMEPSAAAERGARELKLDIRHELLTEATDLGTDFDLIVASEVLEHVTDPVGFLTALKAHIRPDGVVFLSTPAAEAVTPSPDPTEAISALSPGQHVFLCSREGAEKLFARAGFGAVEVTETGPTLIIRASTGETVRPRAADDLSDEAVLDYYRGLARRSARGSALRVGATARHLRLAVTAGRWDEARRAARDVMSAFRRRYSLDLRDPEKAMSAIPSHESALWPLAGVCLALAQMAEREPAGAQRATAYLQLALAAQDRWLQGPVILDRDSLNVRETAAYRRVLLMARTDPSAAAAAAQDLLPEDVYLDLDARRDARESRLLMDLVAAGADETAALLADRVEESAARASMSSDEGRAVDGRDGLYAVGVARQRAGDADGARRAWSACIDACEASSSEQATALRDLARGDLAALDAS